MPLTIQNRRFFRIAGGVNLAILLLSVLFALFLTDGHNHFEHIVKKTIGLTLATSVCWMVNLFLFFVVLPTANNRNIPRWLSFYLPSFLINFSMGIGIFNAFTRVFSDEPIHSMIAGPVFLVSMINALSLVAIELILSRFTQQNIRLENAHIRTENAELRMKSLEAQHEKLIHQLHPHFLFNSLSALKSLIRKDAVLAEDYLVKLSSFLRFSMSHNEQNVVPLEEELKFSIYYLEMQKIRFRDALVYSVEIPEDHLLRAALPVFSLQLTLENAVKHNKLTQAMPLRISVRQVDAHWLLVENNIHEKSVGNAGPGLGLKNLSDRYKLLAEEDIKVENDSEFFRVYLKIIRA